MKKIVVIGAGFAGIMAIKQLLRSKDTQITLISDKDHFLFTPRLTELLNRSVDEKIVIKKLKDVFPERVAIVQEKATIVDLEKKEVQTEKKKISYDYLVASPGAISNFFGNEKFKQQTIDYKDHTAMKRIESRMLEIVQEAASTKKKMEFAVIGGGFTGVELMCSLKERVMAEMKSLGISKEDASFTLIQGGKTILPVLAEKPRKIAEKYLKKQEIKILTETVVTDIENKTITTKQGGKITADLIIWAAGITAQLIDTVPPLQREKGNCIAVMDTGQIPAFDAVYVIGDAALCMNEDAPLPPTAQVAFQEGIAIGNNILRRIKRKSQRQFRYSHKGTLVVLGHNFGIFIFGGIVIKGRIAWLLRDLIYRFRFWQLT